MLSSAHGKQHNCSDEGEQNQTMRKVRTFRIDTERFAQRLEERFVHRLERGDSIAINGDVGLTLPIVVREF